MTAQATALNDVMAKAAAYGEAVFHARADVFVDLCHDRFQMTMIEDGVATFWDKAAYLERVRGRAPAVGEASFEVLGIDVAGAEIARVHLWVDVPPLRYEDHLGFVRVDGDWKLLTKVFRTAARLDGSKA